MGLKDLLLNKGWAGTTLSRRETAERLNPIQRKLYEHMHAYDAAIARLSDSAVIDQLKAFQRTARIDIGKVAETILSAGAAPYNGIDLEPATGGDRANTNEVLRDLLAAEEKLAAVLAEELKQNHQIRTRAILSVLRQNSDQRLAYLRGFKKK